MIVHQSLNLAIFTVVLGLLGLNSTVLGYESPNFDEKFIDADALLLDPSDQENLLEALNSLVCNFPDSEVIDANIRAKALAIALTIDPLNMNSRAAHRALLAKTPPPKTAYFVESVSEVSEALWSSARTIRQGKAEPEAEKLATYLQELSLVISSAPSVSRAMMLSKSTDGEGVSWNRIVKGPSKNEKILAIFEAAEKKVAMRTTTDTTFSGEFTGNENTKKPKPNVVTTDENLIKQTNVSIPFIGHFKGERASGSVAGSASIEIKSLELTSADPEKVEREMKFKLNPQGMSVNRFKPAEVLIRKTYPDWPLGKSAIFTFDASTPPRFKRGSTMNGSLAISLLLQGAFSGDKLHPEVAFAGYILDESESSVPQFAAGEKIFRALVQSRNLDVEYLALPESSYENMLRGAIKTRQLEYLFDPQILSFSTWEQAKEAAFGATDARETASKAFKEIQAVQGKMTLVELSRNIKVKERLNKIIETYPQHMSARVMLAFGNAPDDPLALARQDVEKIDLVLQPIFDTFKNLIQSKDKSMEKPQRSEIIDKIASAELSLSKMHLSTIPKAKPYLKQAEEFLEVSEDVLKSNQRNEGGEQKLKKVVENFLKLQSIKKELGFDEE